MANLIDGKLISTQIKDELKEEVAELKKKGIEGCLAVIQVGNDPASSVYVRNKKKACEYVGIKSLSYELAGDATMLYYMTEEAQEGGRAFLEKRKPDWSKFPKMP